MMLDTNGNAVFVYTPPSIRMAGVSKARDPRHASKLFDKHKDDPSGRWATFHFTSHDNPHLSRVALDDITGDMTSLAYRQEIMAEDIDEIPGALWTRARIEANRIKADKVPPLKRIAIGVDPKASAEADSEAGIIAAGLGEDGHGYALGDYSLNGTPEQWAQKVATAVELHNADYVVVEKNQGGDMVISVLKAAGVKVRIKPVIASRGKYTRAEPVAALDEQGRIHHVGALPWLEDQLCTWLPGDKSPDRLDGYVWVFSDLMLTTRREITQNLG
jgi:phage terminase large subunit-like protein